MFAVLFPLVHFTENHEILQHRLQQGQFLGEHALGSDFILHQGTQELHFIGTATLCDNGKRYRCPCSKNHAMKTHSFPN